MVTVSLRPYHKGLTLESTSRNKELCVPGGGFATVRIELPRDWDRLMAERGCEPLEKFKLASDLKPDAPPRRIRTPTHEGARGDFMFMRRMGRGMR